MNEFSISISANHVAWYGAVLSTIGTSVQLFNHLRDRKSAMISYQRGMSMLNNPNYKRDHKYTIVTVVNTGRRPLTLSHIYLQHSNGEADVFTDTFPRLPHGITEGQQVQAIVDENLMQFDKALWFEALETTGGGYRTNVAGWHRCFAYRVGRRFKRLFRAKS